jgi:hypothetical protein
MLPKLPKIFPLRKKRQPLVAEIIPPSQPITLIETPAASEAMEDRAHRLAEKAGSILGGTIAGFTTGVARHTVAPVAKHAADAAKGTFNHATNAARGTFSFVKMVLIFVFVAVLSVVGLLAIIVASAPRR